MSIWDWVLEAYSQPGASQACLTLQDEYGQNVPFLLWAVHAEVKDPALLARAANAARAWETTAQGPLRAVRRALKAPMPPFDDHGRESLREEVKGLELAAERFLMETLHDMAGGGGGAHALDALEAASATWGKPAPPDALAALAAALI